MLRFFIFVSVLYCTNSFTISSCPSYLKLNKQNFVKPAKLVNRVNSKYNRNLAVALSKKDDQDININAFNNIDVDKSGKLDISELEFYYGKNNYMDIADVNNDNEIDYLEFKRLSNIKKFGLRNGGNLFVRNAINFGLLDKNSILADGEASVFIGNKGFDPLNCSTNINTLIRYREAEIKHGRLAMLASVGWPLAEMVHPYLSNLMNKESLLTSGGKVPSLLNGGLDKINPVFFMAIIVLSATLEYRNINKNYNVDSIQENLEFDPLKLYSTKSVKTKRELELKELNNGRLAMIAITYFAISEFITNTPIAKSFVSMEL